MESNLHATWVRDPTADLDIIPSHFGYTSIDVASLIRRRGPYAVFARRSEFGPAYARYVELLGELRERVVDTLTTAERRDFWQGIFESDVFSLVVSGDDDEARRRTEAILEQTMPKKNRMTAPPQAIALTLNLMYNLDIMSHLWTPWRMPYLQGEEPLPADCLFCVKPQESNAEAHIVHRGELAYVILNRFPYNNGHVMIAPYAHVATLEDLEPETAAELMTLTQLTLTVLREAYAPEGFNVGANIGSAAGAGVADHVHIHAVPRWVGDTNYMTTVGTTRVIPEWMHQTYERLRPLFEQKSKTRTD